MGAGRVAEDAIAVDIPRISQRVIVEIAGRGRNGQRLPFVDARGSRDTHRGTICRHLGDRTIDDLGRGIDRRGLVVKMQPFEVERAIRADHEILDINRLRRRAGPKIELAKRSTNEWLAIEILGNAKLLLKPPGLGPSSVEIVSSTSAKNVFD